MLIDVIEVFTTSLAYLGGIDKVVRRYGFEDLIIRILDQVEELTNGG